MRRALVIFPLLLLTLLALALHQVWTLLALLVVDGRADEIPRASLPALDPLKAAPATDTRRQIIPKILHQTYINASIPLVWQDAQQSCIDLHPERDGWEYRLWTDASALQFIRAEYPWFRPTFEGYRYPIQRADAIRYFVLSHYGGIYLDLDDGCNRPLTPLLVYPAFVRRTLPTGISNDAMGAVPGHPFFVAVTKQLERYDRSWILPYITVMGSTGPLFLSVMWRHWTASGQNVGDGSDGGRIRIIFPDEYNGNPWSFFTHHLGNSWHGADVQFIFWLSRNWLLVTLLGFAIAISLLLTGWFAYRRYFVRGGDAPKWKSASFRQRLPFWRRVSGRKEYELANRHEV
ncbi:hypothetical protein LTR08_008105 [Meristemomyces frigidus]|nr:hypothetical protein LTR08_008105 [Meristemomyces frigidus]